VRAGAQRRLARAGWRESRTNRAAERDRVGRRHDHPYRAARARQGARQAGGGREPAGSRGHRRRADTDACRSGRYDASRSCPTTS
jgi:hypothetical protein